jgi:acetoin utilization deacetylase AcuC-like enzyme
VKLLLATHDSSLRHDTGYGHPERPARIDAVVRGIMGSGLAVEHMAPEPAPFDLLTAIHDRSYIEALERFCAAGGGALDADTAAVADSWEAALRAAAAGPEVCDALAAGAADLGYVAMRPPGHHATNNRAMGFCLFNNVGVTAAYLRDRGFRVAIVDWDVHHGNGTQHSFYSDPDVLYVSIHQQGIYPGTGSLDEVGEAAGIGHNLNIPVPARTGGRFYRRAVTDLVVPVVSQFGPDWLLVSSGYDGHVDDPLAGLELVSGDYGDMARQLASIVAPGRSVVFLEGGYDLDALEAAAAATAQGWLDPEYLVDPETAGISNDWYLKRAAESAARFWQL